MRSLRSLMPATSSSMGPLPPLQLQPLPQLLGPQPRLPRFVPILLDSFSSPPQRISVQTSSRSNSVSTPAAQIGAVRRASGTPSVPSLGVSPPSASPPPVAGTPPPTTASATGAPATGTSPQPSFLRSSAPGLGVPIGNRPTAGSVGSPTRTAPMFSGRTSGGTPPPASQAPGTGGITVTTPVAVRPTPVVVQRPAPPPNGASPPPAGWHAAAAGSGVDVRPLHCLFFTSFFLLVHHILI